MIFTALIILILLLLYAYTHLTGKSRQIDRMFPGPFRIPFIGTVPLNVFERNSKIRKRLAQTYNNRPYRLWFINKPYIMVSDYQTAKMILPYSKYTDKADLYNIVLPIIGRNHFLGTKEVSMKFKKVVAAAFHHKALNRYSKIFDKNCETLCDLLQKHVGKEAFDLKKYIGMFVCDNVTESFGGEQLNWQTDPNLPAFEALQDLTKILRLRTVIPILTVDWIFNLTPLSWRQRKQIQVAFGFLKELLRKKKESIKRNQKLNSSNSAECEESTNEDALGQMIISNEFTDEEILTEIISTIFASFESSTTSIGFLLYLLAEHQEIQEKVYEEVKAVIQDSEAWPDVETLNKMVYTDQVICETLRCYTPFTSIGRYIKEDLHLNEHQFIPKNTNVFISLSGIHKDPIQWPNPQVFDPDRFSPENTEKRDPYAFVAFSCGPGKCTGYKFAIVQIKIAVANVIRKFKLVLSDKPEDKLTPVRTEGMAITSLNGFNVKLQPRDEN